MIIIRTLRQDIAKYNEVTVVDVSSVKILCWPSATILVFEKTYPKIETIIKIC